MLQKTLTLNRLCGRLKVLASLADQNKFTINIGSKETRFGNYTINLDLNMRSHPDIIADANFLPFKSEVFEQALIADVIEHISNELLILSEVYRVLRNNGILILSTPHKHAFYAALDPAHYLHNHKHYSKNQINQFLTKSGFNVLENFTSGGIWASVNILWYSFVTYPFAKMFKMHLQYAPSFMEKLEDREYVGKRINGYTIFSKSIKISEMIN